MFALLVGASAALALLAPAATPAFAASTLSATSVTSTVSGTSVTVSANIANSTTATATYVGICARTANDGHVDFPFVSSTLSPTGKVFTNTKTLPIGTYTYWPCAKIGSTWTNITAPKTFTVAAPTTTPAPSSGVLSATNVAATITGTSVTVTATIANSISKTAEYAGICARNSNDGVIDWPFVSTTLSTTGKVFSFTSVKALGTYRYWPCAKVDGKWTNIGDIKYFTIAAESVAGTPGPSTVSMPVGDLPGWKQVFTEDFTTPLAQGSFPGVYKPQWLSYNGFTDTSGVGHYDQSIISAHDGNLDINLQVKDGKALGAAPVPLVNGKWGGQTYGKFSVRMKSDAIQGFGTGFLLWNDSGDWNDGEVDFPESGLTDVVKGYNHCPGNPAKNCLVVNTAARYTTWHTYSIEWTPAKLTFLIDDVVVGSSTTDIPSKPLHWVMQVATGGTQPAADANGHLLIDWATVYTYVP